MDANDKTAWTNFAGYKGYLLNDMNLDAQTNNLDKNSYWITNQGKNTQVPE